MDTYEYIIWIHMGAQEPGPGPMCPCVSICIHITSHKDGQTHTRLTSNEIESDPHTSTNRCNRSWVTYVFNLDRI